MVSTQSEVVGDRQRILPSEKTSRQGALHLILYREQICQHRNPWPGCSRAALGFPRPTCIPFCSTPGSPLRRPPDEIQSNRRLTRSGPDKGGRKVLLMRRDGCGRRLHHSLRIWLGRSAPGRVQIPDVPFAVALVMGSSFNPGFPGFRGIVLPTVISTRGGLRVAPCLGFLCRHFVAGR